MTKNVFLVILIFCLLTALAPLTDSASKPKKSKIKKEKPFAINIDKLPQHYVGNDFWNLYAYLDARIPAKSEFESTEEYNNKFNKVIVNNAIYAFKLATGAVTYNYDADQRIMQIKLDFDLGITQNISLDEVPPLFYDYDFLHIRYFHAGSNSYVGSNAVGVKKRVQVEQGVAMNVAFHKETLRNTFNLQMMPEEAKHFKKDAAVLLIFKLPKADSKAEIVFDGYKNIEPTIDDPFEAFVLEWYISIVPLEIWIYDFKTGDILLKERPLSFSENAQ